MNLPNSNGQPQMPRFDQNTMEQIQKASASLQQQMQMTPQQRLEQAMTDGTVSQDRYQWARQMANAVMGTNY